MRIKENNSSWRANSIKKRDFKHDHSEQEMLFKSHKNTNKWCRGKVGVKHIVKWHKKLSLFGETMTIGECANCGKHMYRLYRNRT